MIRVEMNTRWSVTSVGLILTMSDLGGLEEGVEVVDDWIVKPHFRFENAYERRCRNSPHSLGSLAFLIKLLRKNKTSD